MAADLLDADVHSPSGAESDASASGAQSEAELDVALNSGAELESSEDSGAQSMGGHGDSAGVRRHRRVRCHGCISHDRPEETLEEATIWNPGRCHGCISPASHRGHETTTPKD